MICILLACSTLFICSECAARHEAHLINIRKITDIFGATILENFEEGLMSNAGFLKIWNDIDVHFESIKEKMIENLNQTRDHIKATLIY